MRDLRKSGIDWIGDIPRVWNTTRLKFVTKIRKEKSIMPEGSVYIGLENIISGYNELIDTETTYDEGIQSLCKNGDILFNKLRPYLNKVIIAPYDAYCTNELLVFSNYTGIKEYLRYLMSSALFIEKVMSITEGTKMPRADGDAILSFWIVHPNIIEQKNIVDYLDFKCLKIDEAISKRKSIIEKLKEYKTAIITKAVTKGINPDVEMKDSGCNSVGLIPRYWDFGKIKFFLEMPITDGPHETPALFPQGIPFVSAEAVSTGNGRIDFNHIRGYISEEYYLECCKKYIPQIDDIYMIKSGATTGKVAIVDTDRIFTIWSPLAVFRVDKKKLIAKYLFYFLQSIGYQQQVQVEWNFGTQQNIGMKLIENLKVCCPALSEQSAIISYLDSQCVKIDEAIANQERLIAKLEEYRKSIIYYAVTGKIDCRKGA